MTQLSPELRAYKEKTIKQLLTNFNLLESKLEQEQRLEVADDIRKQLEAMQDHIGHLQEELETETVGEPVADKLYRRVAGAISNDRFFLANKLLTKLETIEPFYPELDRLRADIEAKRASRRVQSIADGGALPEIILPPDVALPEEEGSAEAPAPEPAAGTLIIEQAPPEPERKPWYGFIFEFHVLVSCMVVMLIACVMFGVGGMTLLQWLIEGG